MPGLLSLTLSHRRPGRIRPSLDRLTEALRQLGNPQEYFSSALLVGTNGKGSTAAMLERVIAAGGIKIGMATSPHLIQVHERIRVGGCDIEDDRLEALVDKLEAFPELTYFETLTAAAFMHFAESGVEIAVLEAGMGGRWDASRAAGSAVVGLTNVGSDHRRWLGDRPEAIADDKGAALAAADIGVYGPQVDRWVIERLALPGAKEASELVETQAPDVRGTLQVRWPGSDYTRLEIPLEGEHQRANLHLALAMAEACRKLGWIGPMKPEVVAKALGGTRWPGRLSKTKVGDRVVLLDGAHNLEAVESLAVFLREQPVRYNMVFACLDDKPARAMADLLRPVVGDVAVCPLEDPRSMPVEALLEAFPGAVAPPGPADAVACLGDPVLAAGSLRLVGALLAMGG
ncbi:MAG: Mur ligase family protein [Acidobacteriota bacterium]